jgi:transposase InsO family protein
MLECELVRESVGRAGKIAAWQKEFNEERPHSALGYQTPAEFARQLLSQVANVV